MCIAFDAGRPIIQGACLEIVRRYRVAGYSAAAASQQAAAFASRFTPEIIDQLAQPRDYLTSDAARRRMAEDMHQRRVRA
jgi:hypothetical protein